MAYRSETSNKKKEKKKRREVYIDEGEDQNYVTPEKHEKRKKHSVDVDSDTGNWFIIAICIICDYFAHTISRESDIEIGNDADAHCIFKCTKPIIHII